MKAQNFLRFLLVLTLLTSFSVLDIHKTRAQIPGFVPGQLLVGWESQLTAGSASAKATALAAVSGEEIEQIPEILLSVVRVPEGTEAAAIGALQGNPKVAYAELDEMASPPRPMFQSWTDYWNVQQTELERALNYVGTTPYQAVVALVDTGTSEHQEIAGRLLGGYAVSGGNPHDPNCGDPYYDGHGNACASLAAGQGLSVIGICPVCKIYPIKIYYPRQGTCLAYTSEAVEGIVHAANQGNVDVIAVGFAGRENSSSLRNAANYAASQGKVVIAARGNDNNSSPRYPASYAGVLGVIASDRDNLRVKTPKHNWGSSYGKTEDQHLVSAPGESTIRTAWEANDAYIDDFGGTSAAYPQPAGLAGLLKSEWPVMSRAQIIAAIENGCDDIEATGWDHQSGHGRINVARSVGLDGLPMILDWVKLRIVDDRQQSVILRVVARDKETYPLVVSIVAGGITLAVSQTTPDIYWGTWVVPANPTPGIIVEYPVIYTIQDATNTVAVTGTVLSGGQLIYLPLIMRN